MIRKTLFSELLYAADIKVQYDEYVKWILSTRQVLARILLGAVKEYSALTLEDVLALVEEDSVRSQFPGGEKGEYLSQTFLRGENTESVLPQAGKVAYDIRLRAGLPEIGEERESDYDKLSVVLICLNEDAPFPSASGLHHFLCTLLSTRLSVEQKEEILTKEYGMVMEEEMKEEMREMCNLSEAIEERGIEKGIEKGIERGQYLELYALIRGGFLTMGKAAESRKLSEEKLCEKLLELGIME